MSEKIQPHNFIQNGKELKSYLPSTRVNLKNLQTVFADMTQDIQIRIKH